MWRRPISLMASSAYFATSTASPSAISPAARTLPSATTCGGQNARSAATMARPVMSLVRSDSPIILSSWSASQPIVSAAASSICPARRRVSGRNSASALSTIGSNLYASMPAGIATSGPSRTPAIAAAPPAITAATFRDLPGCSSLSGPSLTTRTLPKRSGRFTGLPVTRRFSLMCSNESVSASRLPDWWPWPERCQAGHSWGPGKVVVGWHPCDCPVALAQPGKGHLAVRCAEPGCTSAWFKPRCGAGS